MARKECKMSEWCNWAEKLIGISKAEWIGLKYEIDKAFQISDREAAKTVILTEELSRKAEREV